MAGQSLVIIFFSCFVLFMRFQFVGGGGDWFLTPKSNGAHSGGITNQVFVLFFALEDICYFQTFHDFETGFAVRWCWLVVFVMQICWLLGCFFFLGCFKILCSCVCWHYFPG